MRAAQYVIESETDDCVLIRDIGPWDQHFTVTQDADQVAEKLAPMLHGRRLEYIDSHGERDQILVKDGTFAGFAPAQGDSQ